MSGKVCFLIKRRGVTQVTALSDRFWEQTFRTTVICHSNTNLQVSWRWKEQLRFPLLQLRTYTTAFELSTCCHRLSLFLLCVIFIVQVVKQKPKDALPVGWQCAGEEARSVVAKFKTCQTFCISVRVNLPCR